MYRILIADDEGIMLESLRKMIENNYGREVEIACAKTGRAVIELAESFRPEIIFMDIQMPGLSGVQAMREIRKFNENTIFIVITAYDRFNYAQECISLGVLEFLTKPVNKKTILAACDKAIKKVDDSRKKRSDDLKIREKLETVVPMIESGYIYNLLLLDEFSAYEDQYRELLDIQADNAFMIVTEFGDSDENGTLTNAIGVSVRASRFYSEFRETAQGFFDCIAGPVMGNRIVLLIPHKENSVTYEERIDILESARNMVHKLETKIGDVRFRAGIGKVKPLENAKESYMEALQALREGSSHVVHINDIPIVQEYDGEYPRELEDHYIQHVLEADEAEAVSIANRFFDWMIHSYADYREDIEIKVLEMIMRVEYQAFRKGAAHYGFRYREHYIRTLQECAGYEELRRWYVDKTREICRGMTTVKEKESESVITRAKAYIDENFRKDISLDDVSRHVDISPYYFSKLFKQQDGRTFIEYLTGVRIHEARRLLRSPGYSIKEIGIMCGYSDPNYFSRIFKKYEGVTPSEFRERP